MENDDFIKKDNKPMSGPKPKTENAEIYNIVGKEVDKRLAAKKKEDDEATPKQRKKRLKGNKR